ncbi:MAG: hypothetical protein H7345_01440 [Rubritepida sp.]|nr:hypothetical protein [Rubritepida sp.]
MPDADLFVAGHASQQRRTADQAVEQARRAARCADQRLGHRVVEAGDAHARFPQSQRQILGHVARVEGVEHDDRRTQRPCPASEARPGCQHGKGRTQRAQACVIQPVGIVQQQNGAFVPGRHPIPDQGHADTRRLEMPAQRLKECRLSHTSAAQECHALRGVGPCREHSFPGEPPALMGE